jgi:type IV secretion system protein VirD4
MNRAIENRKTGFILWGLGLIPVVWAALIVAPFLSKGLSGIMTAFTNGMNDPTAISWCADSLKAILVSLLMYALGSGIYYALKRNYRKGEEHGSAKWGDPKQLSRKYADRSKPGNILLSQNVRIGLDGRKHRRNLNVMVVGGSGSGKTRFYAKPNVMQCNTSFVVLDPKGGATRS